MAADASGQLSPPTGLCARVMGLDAARAVAVTAMVFGHTMDAVLSDQARATPWVATYWTFRTFTAPLFLFVSGWTVLMLTARSGLTGWPALRRFLPRAALLYAISFALRFPIWELNLSTALSPSLWNPFRSFDALDCIAASLLVATAVCACFRSDAARAAALLAFAGALVFAAPATWTALAGSPAYPTAATILAGTGSRFPMLPWTAYFLLGGVFGIAFARARRAAFFGVAALAVVGLFFTLTRPDVFLLPNSEPLKFAWRLGPVALVMGACFLLPHRAARALSPIGRASLTVYVLHLPISYGWGWWGGLAHKIGRTLNDSDATLTAVAVVAFSVVGGVLLPRVSAALPRRRSESLVAADR